VPDAATPRAPCAAALHLSLFSGAALARRNGTLPVIVAAALSGAARMRIAAVVAELNKHPAAAPFLSWTPIARGCSRPCFSPRSRPPLGIVSAPRDDGR